VLPPAIFIMGPTAAGKTDLAIAIADELPVEIISVDSALVYKGMDIGTAKPNSTTLAEYPHHLVDIIEPSEKYSVGQFCSDAKSLMAEITARGKVPLLVGGTMLYFNALQYGISELPTSDEKIRQQMNTDLLAHGPEFLHKRLEKIDPISAKRINVNDPQRVQRALEVYYITGKSMTELTENSGDALSYNVTKIILSPFTRSILHSRIENRYQRMLTDGFVDEVTRLFQREDCHAGLPSIRAVGYRQAWSYLKGDYDRDEFVYKAIVATRQMAKRQITWLRSQKDGTWFNSDVNLPTDAVKQYLLEQVSQLRHNA